ncbi:MAG TPA: SRPBCC family protein [Rhizomicrobium sp.]|jgi:uncharacterized protein YndB with AHSA1/START domain
MTARIAAAPVRKSIRVKANQAKAFTVFTASIGQWWPKSHHIGTAPMKTAYIEPFQGGRWYHVSEDGSEYDNGFVRVWQPPQRVVLTWRLNAQFQLDDDVDSEIDIRFVPDGDGTRVELEHRVTAIDAETIAAAVASPGGWPDILRIYADAAQGN